MTGLVTADLYDRVRAATEQFIPAGIATIIMGPAAGAKLAVVEDEQLGSLGNDELDRQAVQHIADLIEAEKSETVSMTAGGEQVEVFFDIYPAPPTLIIFGAVHVAQSLTWLAKRLGYRVLVTDARAMLATEERFPEADQILVAWPDEALGQFRIGRNTYLAILTHDPKFDEPALVGALETRARYIGAVGSRKTNRDRRERLRNAGVSDESMSRIRGPIGLDIGAQSPEEMAVSIMAEIIA
ncbi:MAG: XdhC family protein, partial [Chloroflexota bacterium]|nr:XdhC family protein [Chloroflexota bacterium]